MKTCIIDYSAGNLTSVYRALKFLGLNAVISMDKAEIAAADKIILPGVGNFGYAAASLSRSGLDKTIKSEINKGKPFLGICLGMQLLYETSAESPGINGLCVFQGGLQRFGSLKVPHMGWNTVKHNNFPLFKGLPAEPYMYFVHSYYVPQDLPNAAASTGYGVDFTSACARDNVFGVQFHPEKSGDEGLQVLKNYGAM